MSTRGAFGFRKNGVDKVTYNPYDSYPDYLGRIILEFCKNTSIEDLNTFCNNIEITDEENVENDFSLFIERGMFPKSMCKMNDDSDFIKNSLYCEYAYIINLDTNNLEYYVGFQEKPQKGNRYGENSNKYGYYPCRLAFEVSLDGIDNVDGIVKRMNGVEE